jgi:hypothetical protein
MIRLSSCPVAARLVVLLALLLSLDGCAGYRVGNTSGRTLQGVRSVYVPMARNTSLVPDLQMTVTNAVIRRFNTDGTLETNQSQNADSEIDIVITDVEHVPIRSSSNDILVTAEYQLNLKATVTYVNRKLGRKIFENAQMQGTTSYFTQSDIQEGERQALPLAAEDLANNIVKQVTEGW